MKGVRSIPACLSHLCMISDIVAQCGCKGRQLDLVPVRSDNRPSRPAIYALLLKEELTQLIGRLLKTHLLYMQPIGSRDLITSWLNCVFVF